MAARLTESGGVPARSPRARPLPGLRRARARQQRGLLDLPRGGAAGRPRRAPRVHPRARRDRLPRRAPRRRGDRGRDACRSARNEELRARARDPRGRPGRRRGEERARRLRLRAGRERVAVGQPAELVWRRCDDGRAAVDGRLRLRRRALRDRRAARLGVVLPLHALPASNGNGGLRERAARARLVPDRGGRGARPRLGTGGRVREGVLRPLRLGPLQPRPGKRCSRREFASAPSTVTRASARSGTSSSPTRPSGSRSRTTACRTIRNSGRRPRRRRWSGRLHRLRAEDSRREPEHREPEQREREEPDGECRSAHRRSTPRRPKPTSASSTRDRCGRPRARYNEPIVDVGAVARLVEEVDLPGGRRGRRCRARRPPGP